MHKRSVVLVGATLLMTGVLLGTQTSGQTTPRPETAAAQPDAKGAADQMFASEAAIAGMAEVELGKMAMQQGSNAKVKSSEHNDGSEQRSRS